MTAIALEPIQRLSKDIKEATITLSRNEVRFLVDSYYTMQENRIRANNQIRALNEADEPHQVIDWLAIQNQTLENQVKRALGYYSANHPVGEWLLSICGIGDVISAGLLAHIDITKAPSPSHIWRFAGLDPTIVWEKGQKRPYNAALKVLCWKLGESFVKVSNNDKDFYGKLYVKYKADQTAKNERGEFAQTARESLEKKKFGKDTEAFKAYEQGKLPKGRIQLRAQRYAVKILLSHLHDQLYRWHFQTAPPRPYALEHLGHVDYIPVPNPKF